MAASDDLLAGIPNAPSSDDLLAGIPDAPALPAMSVVPAHGIDTDLSDTPIGAALLSKHAAERAAADARARALAAAPTLLDTAVKPGLRQAASGLEHLYTGEGGRINAMGDVVEGGLETVSPLMYPAILAGAVAAPVETALAVGAGNAAPPIVRQVGAAVGARPDVTRLGADIAGLTTAGKYGLEGLREAIRPGELPPAAPALPDTSPAPASPSLPAEDLARLRLTPDQANGMRPLEPWERDLIDGMPDASADEAPTYPTWLYRRFGGRAPEEAAADDAVRAAENARKDARPAVPRSVSERPTSIDTAPPSVSSVEPINNALNDAVASVAAGEAEPAVRSDFPSSVHADDGRAPLGVPSGGSGDGPAVHAAPDTGRGAAPAAGRSPLVDDAPAEQPAPQPVSAAPLPKELASAKPRYGYGPRQFTLAFDHPLDKAAYIIAQQKPSARDADYLRYVMDNTGLSETEARAYGADVKARIKPLAAGAPEGVTTIQVPHTGAAAPGGVAELSGGLGVVKGAVPERLAVIGREIRDTVNAPGASLEAQRAADIVRQSRADVANANSLEFERANPSIFTRIGDAIQQRSLGPLKASSALSFFNRRTNEANVSNISDYERTGRFSTEPTPGYSDLFRASMDQAHALLVQAYGNDRVSYVDNYVRRMFRFGTKADEDKASGVLLNLNQKGSLSATRSPLKARVLDVPLDDALQQMRAAGIRVEPATTNPEELRQWSLANARQAVAYKQAWNGLKSEGLVKFIRTGARRPDGLVPLSDRVATKFFPGESGLTLAGQYYAPPEVARVLDRSISKGLASGGLRSTVDAIRHTANAMSMTQLALSGFHLANTAVNASLTDLSIGARQVGRSVRQADPALFGRGTINIARSIPLVSFLGDIREGAQLTRDLATAAPDALHVLNEKLNPAGARLHMDQAYQAAAAGEFRKAWSNSQYLTALSAGARQVVQSTMAPLMEYAVPRVKLAAFMRLAADVDDRLPNAGPAEKVREYAKAWDTIDDRFGEMVYDNLFWEKSAKDLLHMAVRSVGWNLGTFRVFAGALSDVAKRDFSDRVTYALALPIYVGTLGAIYQYLHTGQLPQSTKDYFYPRNGEKDASGNDERIALPSYMKDVGAFSRDPYNTVLAKTNPLPNFLIDVARNRDYFENLVRNPDDPAWKQAEQVGTYALKQFEPFSVEQYGRLGGESGATLGKRAEAFLGVLPAPRAVVKSAAEREAQQLLGDRLGDRHLTPEQQDQQTLKAQARADIRAGRSSAALQRLVGQRVFKNQASLQAFIRSAHQTPYQRELAALSPAERRSLVAKEGQP